MSQSELAEKAVKDVFLHGKALLKFITANNVGLTGGHECGYYLPINAWELFADYPPKKGINTDKLVKITWQDGELLTNSKVKWYGAKTRFEYRLTRFGRDFPYLEPENVGDMLVLVRTGTDTFNAYVFNSEEAIEYIQSALGVEIIDNTWGVYPPKITREETVNDCIIRHFKTFVAKTRAFPLSSDISGTTLRAILECIKNFKFFLRMNSLRFFLTGNTIFSE